MYNFKFKGDIKVKAIEFERIKSKAAQVNGCYCIFPSEMLDILQTLQKYENLMEEYSLLVEKHNRAAKEILHLNQTVAKLLALTDKDSSENSPSPAGIRYRLTRDVPSEGLKKGG